MKEDELAQNREYQAMSWRPKTPFSPTTPQRSSSVPVVAGRARQDGVRHGERTLPTAAAGPLPALRPPGQPPRPLPQSGHAAQPGGLLQGEPHAPRQRWGHLQSFGQRCEPPLYCTQMLDAPGGGGVLKRVCGQDSSALSRCLTR